MELKEKKKRGGDYKMRYSSYGNRKGLGARCGEVRIIHSVKGESNNWLEFSLGGGRIGGGGLFK